MDWVLLIVGFSLLTGGIALGILIGINIGIDRYWRIVHKIKE
jgi:hypothetical protein